MSLSDDSFSGHEQYSSKRKLPANDEDFNDHGDNLINANDLKKKKRKQNDHDEVIIGMTTLLKNQPDEVIESILDFLPPKATINVSSVCQQFRRVWKQNPNGIVYNMIIQLNYSFKKRYYSEDDKIQVANFAKSAIIGAFIQVGGKSDKILSKTELFVDQLSKLEGMSENFTAAISKIDRFDYGQDDNMYYSSSIRQAAGFEISFGKLGVMRYWQWKEREEYGDSNAFARLSKPLESLKLSEEEWDAMIEIAIGYFEDISVEICFYEFQYEDDMGDSIFVDNELVPSLPCE